MRFALGHFFWTLDWWSASGSVQFGHVTLPTFGVLAAVGLLAGLGLSQRTARLAGWMRTGFGMPGCSW